MSDDILRAATRALREQEPATDAARFTRARVMASLHKRERRRHTRVAFLLPVAAVLVGSTAWGAASGRLPTKWQDVSSVLGLSAAPSAPSLARPAEKGAELSRRASKRVAPAAAPAAPAALAEAAPAAPAAEPAAPAALAAPAAFPAPEKPAAAPDPGHELYRAAHRKHFTEGDPAAALAAWDAYLAAAPRGRFATEARYNRALCLVRLGRSAEARAALEPFATGRFGGYRQREASELSAALGGS